MKKQIKLFFCTLSRHIGGGEGELEAQKGELEAQKGGVRGTKRGSYRHKNGG